MPKRTKTTGLVITHQQLEAIIKGAVSQVLDQRDDDTRLKYIREYGAETRSHLAERPDLTKTAEALQVKRQAAANQRQADLSAGVRHKQANNQLSKLNAEFKPLNRKISNAHTVCEFNTDRVLSLYQDCMQYRQSPKSHLADQALPEDVVEFVKEADAYQKDSSVSSPQVPEPVPQAG